MHIVLALKTPEQFQIWGLIYHHCIENIMNCFLHMKLRIPLCFMSLLHKSKNLFAFPHWVTVAQFLDFTKLHWRICILWNFANFSGYFSYSCFFFLLPSQWQIVPSFWIWGTDSSKLAGKYEHILTLALGMKVLEYEHHMINFVLQVSHEFPLNFNPSNPFCAGM